MTSLIWLIVVVLVVMWLLGFSVFHVAGNLIFLLLVLAIAGVVYNLLMGGMSSGGAHHHHHTEVTEVDREV